LTLGGVGGETSSGLTGGVASPENTDRTDGEYAERRGGLDTIGGEYIGLDNGGDTLRSEGIDVDDARLAGRGDIGGDRGSEVGGELTSGVMGGELGGVQVE